MAGKIKGITIEIGGNTTKLDKALQASQKQGQNLASELRQIDKLLKFDPGNVELLTQKQKVLSEQVENTSDKLKLLRDAQEQVVEQFERGEIGEEQMRAFQREIASTESYLAKMESQLAECTAEIEKMGQASSAMDELVGTINRQEQELSDLKKEYANVVLEQGKTSTEAQELASRISALNGELNENRSRLNAAESEADQLTQAFNEVGDSADDAEGGFTIMKGAIADLTANAIQSAIGAIGDLVGSLLELSETTEEYRSMMGKVAGSADSFGYSVDFANSKYQEFYKYLGDDQMATNAITNLMGMKVSTDTVSDAANAAIAVWSAYGDSIPIEGLTESINESAQVAAVTGSLADAINWAKRSNEDWSAAMSGHSAAQAAFNKAISEGETAEDAYSAALAACSDTQERADLIAQTLNQTFGKSKETYDDLSEGILDANEAELELKESQAELGSAVEPVNTALNNLKSQALEAILPIVQNLSDAFLDLLNWFKEHPAAVTVLTGVITGLAGAFTVLAGALAIQGIIRGVTTAFKFLSTTLLANPIVLVIAAIAGLVTAFMTLWKTSETFRNFWIGLWDTIKSTVSNVASAIAEFFTVTIPTAFNNFLTLCSTTISNIGAFFTSLGQSIVTFFTNLPSQISEFLTMVITTVTTWGTNLWTTITTSVSNAISAVVTFFSELPNKIGYALGFAIGTIIKWGLDIYNWVTTEIPKIIESIVTFFSELPGKIWTWLLNTWQNLIKWGQNMLKTGTDTAKNLVTTIINFVKELPPKIWNAIVSAVSNLQKWGSQMLSAGRTAITDVVNTIFNTAKSIPGKITSAISGAISALSSWGSQMLSTASRAISKVANAIVDGLKSVPSKMANIGRNIVEGIWNGISGAVGWIRRKIEGFANSVLGGIKEALGIHSPSRVMRDEVGKFISEGIAVGIKDNEDSPIKALKDLTNDMIDTKGINGVTLNRQIEHTFATPSSGGSIAELTALMAKWMPELIKVSHHDIYLDGDTFVGETIDRIDNGLAQVYRMKERGM